MEILIGKTAGFCYGVKRAVDESQAQIGKKEKLYCLGELVHNKQVVADLKEKGIIFIENLDDVKEENATVIIRAHGVPKDIYKIAKQRNIDLIDLTCPSVLKIKEIIDKHNKEGFYIFLTGEESHPEVIGIKSYADNNLSIINDICDVDKAIIEFENSKLNNLLLISQTTFGNKKFNIIKNIIKEKISPNINFVIKNTVCNATDVRQQETKELSVAVDKMIIIGGKNSHNTRKLYEIASEFCKDAIFIESVEDLKTHKFEGCKKIGIMAGASTPQNEINKVVKYLNIM